MTEQLRGPQSQAPGAPELPLLSRRERLSYCRPGGELVTQAISWPACAQASGTPECYHTGLSGATPCRAERLSYRQQAQSQAPGAPELLAASTISGAGSA